MIRTETEKLNVYGDESGEYFDLAADPNEFYNRIADPAVADRVAALRERLDRWQVDHAAQDANRGEGGPPST